MQGTGEQSTRGPGARVQDGRATGGRANGGRQMVWQGKGGSVQGFGWQGLREFRAPGHLGWGRRLRNIP
jgi:hypothetical protein